MACCVRSVWVWVAAGASCVGLALVTPGVGAQSYSREGDAPGVGGPSTDRPRAEFRRDWFYASDDSLKYEALKKLQGRVAPALQTSEWLGEKQDLSKLKGKIVVLDFWATWCRPCIEAIPHNNKLAEKFERKGVMVVGVCCTRGAETMVDVASEKGMRYPTGADVKNATEEAHGVKWWPFYVLIDRKGIVRAAGLRPEFVTTAVEELLKEQPWEK